MWKSRQIRGRCPSRRRAVNARERACWISVRALAPGTTAARAAGVGEKERRGTQLPSNDGSKSAASL